jgi:hypothetical protein
MSMMKPDANQTTSMGMMELMGARTGRLRESNALSVSVPSTRCGSFLRPITGTKKRWRRLWFVCHTESPGAPPGAGDPARAETGDATVATVPERLCQSVQAFERPR